MIPVPIDPEAQREIVKAGREYADKILIQPLEQIGGILSDQIGHWRLRNQARCLWKTREYLKEKGVDPRKLLPDVFVPLIEEAGNTSDETLSDMFARLLAGQLDPNEPNAIHPSFCKVLGQLSPLDAKILSFIDDRERKLRQNDMSTDDWYGWTMERNAARFQDENKNVQMPDIMLSLNNLQRLGLWENDPVPASMDLPAPKFEDQGNGIMVMADGPFDRRVNVPLPEQRVVISKFGKTFLRACNDPATYWRQQFTDKDEEEFRWRSGWR